MQRFSINLEDFEKCLKRIDIHSPSEFILLNCVEADQKEYRKLDEIWGNFICEKLNIDYRFKSQFDDKMVASGYPYIKRIEIRHIEKKSIIERIKDFIRGPRMWPKGDKTPLYIGKFSKKEYESMVNELRRSYLLRGLSIKRNDEDDDDDVSVFLEKKEESSESFMNAYRHALALLEDEKNCIYSINTKSPVATIELETNDIFENLKGYLRKIEGLEISSRCTLGWSWTYDIEIFLKN